MDMLLRKLKSICKLFFDFNRKTGIYIDYTYLFYIKGYLSVLETGLKVINERGWYSLYYKFFFEKVLDVAFY